MRSFGTKDTTTTTTTQQQLSQSEFGRVFFLDKKIVGPFEWKNVSSLMLKEYYKQRVYLYIRRGSGAGIIIMTKKNPQREYTTGIFRERKDREPKTMSNSQIGFGRRRKRNIYCVGQKKPNLSPPPLVTVRFQSSKSFV